MYYSRVLPVVYAGVFLTAAAFPASAATYNDYYVGGSVVGTPNVDTLQGTGIHTFEVDSMTVTHTGNTLNVSISTKYAGHDGFEQTNYGALFIKTNGPVVDGIGNPVRPDAANPYLNDTSTAGPNNFNYAVVLPGGLGTGSKSGNDASLVALNTDASNIQISYWPNSSVNNNANNSGGIFRNGQAVDVKNNPATVDPTIGYSIIQDLTITFSIDNFFNLLGPEFALAWAMTCGNDVILINAYTRDIDCTNCNTDVPVPAALPLFASAIGAGGLLTYRRRRRAVTAR